MSPIELGKFIASLRNEKNLTQEELAEKLYIDKRKISRWECGTSIPEFEMLIKLSEILDVSLYEFSICQKIENESLHRKIINKFKSIKDFKKYKAIKKIKIISLIIFFILFIITSTFTIKYNNSAEIYKLESLDEDYYLDGTFVSSNNYSLFFIKNIQHTKDGKIDDSITFNNCEYQIYDNNVKKIHIQKNNNEEKNEKFNSIFHELDHRKKLNNNIELKIKCIINNNKIDYYSFNAKLVEKYSNILL